MLNGNNFFSFLTFLEFFLMNFRASDADRSHEAPKGGEVGVACSPEMDETITK